MLFAAILSVLLPLDLFMGTVNSDKSPPWYKLFALHFPPAPHHCGSSAHYLFAFNLSQYSAETWTTVVSTLRCGL